MNLETAFHISQYLKIEFQGNARTRSMRVLNLRREFQLQKMKDSDTVKEYVDRLLEIINKLKLLVEGMPNNRIVEKILVTLLEISLVALEEVQDLTEISLAELLNALHAQEQRRQIREDGSVEGIMQAKFNFRTLKRQEKKGKNNKGNPSAGAGNNSTSGVCSSGAVGSNQELIDGFKTEILKEFEMTNLKLMSYFLGLEMNQKKNEIFISQCKYAKCMINWHSKKQEIIAQSTAEAEFVAATAIANHALTEDQIVDAVTKALSKVKFEALQVKMGVCNIKDKKEC
ncbi:hypothetical protein GH714_017248 [Hevea brasiliensis]|uniref:Reverse transcriptase Ty1/copia-type domain-containing protein n=1 Tax=Hevea brasiliensis TaxID=3981 RepID=A0A6A6NI05_HEVBR|nr:hypothetical protein GH714_017248 [Hevea brasiliensis]